MFHKKIKIASCEVIARKNKEFAFVEKVFRNERKLKKDLDIENYILVSYEVKEVTLELTDEHLFSIYLEEKEK